MQVDYSGLGTGHHWTSLDTTGNSMAQGFVGLTCLSGLTAIVGVVDVASRSVLAEGA